MLLSCLLNVNVATVFFILLLLLLWMAFEDFESFEMKLWMTEDVIQRHPSSRMSSVIENVIYKILPEVGKGWNTLKGAGQSLEGARRRGNCQTLINSYKDNFENKSTRDYVFWREIYSAIDKH